MSISGPKEIIRSLNRLRIPSPEGAANRAMPWDMMAAPSNTPTNRVNEAAPNNKPASKAQRQRSGPSNFRRTNRNKKLRATNSQSPAGLTAKRQDMVSNPVNNTNSQTGSRRSARQSRDTHQSPPRAEARVISLERRRDFNPSSIGSARYHG